MFGFYLPNKGELSRPDNIVRLAILAENIGFDSLWVRDHVVIPKEIASQYPYSVKSGNPFDPFENFLEPLNLLSFLSGVTKSIRLGTHVLILPYRNPLITAKVVATLDHLSAGRFILGCGVGWMEEEFLALGLDTYHSRGALTDESIAILRTLWMNDTASFKGEFYQFNNVRLFPKPVQKPCPPIWIGGHSMAAIKRAARLGDAWLPVGLKPSIELHPNDMEKAIIELATLSKDLYSRTVVPTVCFSATMEFHNDFSNKRQLLTGSPEAIIEDINEYKEVGVEDFIFNYATDQTSSLRDIVTALELFGSSVFPFIE